MNVIRYGPDHFVFGNDLITESMEETFTLPMQYKGKEVTLEFTFRRLGYTYKISTQIGNQEVLFEPDEEGSFRATLANPHKATSSKDNIDSAFIAVISQALTEALK